MQIICIISSFTSFFIGCKLVTRLKGISKLQDNIEDFVKHCSADYFDYFPIPCSSSSSTKLSPVATSASRWTPILSQSASKFFTSAYPEESAFCSWNHYFNFNISNQKASTFSYERLTDDSFPGFCLLI